MMNFLELYPFFIVMLPFISLALSHFNCGLVLSALFKVDGVPCSFCHSIVEDARNWCQVHLGSFIFVNQSKRLFKVSLFKKSYQFISLN